MKMLSLYEQQQLFYNKYDHLYEAVNTLTNGRIKLAINHGKIYVITKVINSQNQSISGQSEAYTQSELMTDLPTVVTETFAQLLQTIQTVETTNGAVFERQIDKKFEHIYQTIQDIMQPSKAFKPVHDNELHLLVGDAALYLIHKIQEETACSITVLDNPQNAVNPYHLRISCTNQDEGTDDILVAVSTTEGLSAKDFTQQIHTLITEQLHQVFSTAKSEPMLLEREKVFAIIKTFNRQYPIRPTLRADQPLTNIELARILLAQPNDTIVLVESADGQSIRELTRNDISPAWVTEDTDETVMLLSMHQ